MSAATDLESLRPWASPRQAEMLDAMREHGTQHKAAEALGVTQKAVWNMIQVLKQKAARYGHSPAHDMTKTTPPGFHVKGTSTLYGADGEQKLQWVKTQIDADQHIAAMMDALQSLVESAEAAQRPRPAPPDRNADLLCTYLWGDPHIGMYAWAEETRDRDWDVAIAEECHVNAMADLIELAPAAKVGALILVGDNQHADNFQNVTSRSKHSLDVDTRLPRVTRGVVSTSVRSIDMMLDKHEIVLGKIGRGNHDDVLAMALAFILHAYYRNEPRVQIDIEPGVFKWIRHGLCLLGITHGDTMKPQQMRDVMTVDQREAWGETEFWHIYSGHIHTDIARDLASVTVESLSPISPRDAYATAAGYRSRSEMRCDVWHSKFGRRQRFMVGPRGAT